MRSKLKLASVAAVAATMASAFISAGGSGAAAEAMTPVAVKSEPHVRFISKPVIQPLPSEDEEGTASSEQQTDQATQESADSLADLVAVQPQPAKLSRQLKCLATAIYFEARGETLSGQLAVGRVVVERAKSGRFPDSYCGVVFQPFQFSFVRGHHVPAIRRDSQAWKNAVAVAEIADAGTWRSPVEGALFFHAARVSPGWHHTRMAQIDNHIFFR